MKHYFVFLCFLAIFFSACKKDNDSTDSGGTGSNKKLLKESYTSGQFSLSLTYVYDANGRLAKLHQESTGGGSTTRQGFSLTRDAAGMVTKIVYLDDGSPDSLTVTVSSSGQRYTKAVESYTRFGSTTTKTTEFVYDNAGHIVQLRAVNDFDGSQMPAVTSEFTYQNNNLTVAKTHQSNTLLYQHNFTYDSKNNPLPAQDEWILYSLTFTSFYERASANNVTSTIYKQPGSADETVSASYTYNAQNLPVTVTSTTQGGPVATGTYTYE